MSNEINAKIKFLPLANGKFTWKIYDENGSVIERAGIEFDSMEACNAHFNEWQAANSEAIGVAEENTPDPAADVAPAQNGEFAPTENTASAPEVAAEVAPETTTPEANAPETVDPAAAEGQPVEQQPQDSAPAEGQAAGTLENAGSANL